MIGAEMQEEFVEKVMNLDHCVLVLCVNLHV